MNFMDGSPKDSELLADISHRHSMAWLAGRLIAPPDLSAEDGRDRAAALYKLALEQPPEPATRQLLRDRLQDEGPDVRAVAAILMARLWSGDAAAISLLRGRFEAEEDAFVHGVILQELPLCGKHDHGLLAYFRQRAIAAPDWRTRQEGIVALARTWKEEPETLRLLQERAVTDPDDYVRLQALNELLSGWAHDPQTVSLVKERGFKDRSREVRQNLKDALRSVDIDGGTLGNDAVFFRSLALHDRDPEVRQAALVWLAQEQQEEVDLMGLCRHIAVHDADELTRGLALEILSGATRWDSDASYESSTLHDSDPAVRKAAIIRLARAHLPAADAEFAALCRDVAVQDPDASLRALALEIAAIGYRGDSATLSLLGERAAHDNDPEVRDQAAFLTWWITFRPAG